MSTGWDHGFFSLCLKSCAAIHATRNRCSVDRTLSHSRSASRRGPLNTARWEAHALYQLLSRRETRQSCDLQTGNSSETCGITQNHSKKRNDEDIKVTKTCDWLLLLVMTPSRFEVESSPFNDPDQLMLSNRKPFHRSHDLILPHITRKVSLPQGHIVKKVNQCGWNIQGFHPLALIIDSWDQYCSFNLGKKHSGNIPLNIKLCRAAILVFWSDNECICRRTLNEGFLRLTLRELDRAMFVWLQSPSPAEPARLQNFPNVRYVLLQRSQGHILDPSLWARKSINCISLFDLGGELSYLWSILGAH